jgi:tetratricopeptide (TPR) repeat protein
MNGTAFPSTNEPLGPCPDAELLASVIDGRATAAERTAVEAHVARCEDCYFLFAETVRATDNGASTQQIQTWPRYVPHAAVGLAVAATLIVAVAASVRYQTPAPPPLVVALNDLDAAGGPYRPFEARVTSLPTYRAPVPATRSAAQANEVGAVLRERAAVVESIARGNASPDDRRALVAAYLAQGEAARAVGAVQPIDASATEAALLADAAAAYLARDEAGDARAALTLLERAVRLDPRRPEAWFNLGLAAEKAGEPSRAKEAWTQYLTLDSSSEWAAEARRHLGASR